VVPAPYVYGDEWWTSGGGGGGGGAPGLETTAVGDETRAHGGSGTRRARARARDRFGSVRKTTVSLNIRGDL